MHEWVFHIRRDLLECITSINGTLWGLTKSDDSFLKVKLYYNPLTSAYSWYSSLHNLLYIILEVAPVVSSSALSLVLGLEWAAEEKNQNDDACQKYLLAVLGSCSINFSIQLCKRLLMGKLLTLCVSKTCPCICKRSKVYNERFYMILQKNYLLCRQRTLVSNIDSYTNLPNVSHSKDKKTRRPTAMFCVTPVKLSNFQVLNVDKTFLPNKQYVYYHQG